MKFILGKKVNMTQIWQDDKVLAVTKVQAGPCFITQIKDQNNDSYQAIQVAFAEKKSKNISKPVRGHLKKAGIEKENARYIREFRINEIKPEMKVGGVIDVSTFAPGDIIDVVGVSKGKGFQGVVRRHGFSGKKKTHGNKDQLRASGSIGAKGPAHVFKGMRMGGRMGGDRVTIKNLEVVAVDLENNILFIKGAVPGGEKGLLMIKGQGDLIIKDKASLVEEKKSEVIREESNSENQSEEQEVTKDEISDSSSVENINQEKDVVIEKQVEVKEEEVKEKSEEKPEEKNEAPEEPQDKDVTETDKTEENKVEEK